MFEDSIHVNGHDHEVWDDKGDRERLGLAELSVIGIPPDGNGEPVRGTVSMGPDGLYFRVEDKLFALNLGNAEAVCMVFASVIDAVSESHSKRMRSHMKTLATTMQDTLAALAAKTEKEKNGE